MATLQNFDQEIAKTKRVVEDMRSKIEESGIVLEKFAQSDKKIGDVDFNIENARIEDVLKQQKVMEGNIADLIIGLEKTAIGTLVERSSRYTMLLHLPRLEGFGTTPYVKNGPPTAGHGAEAVREAITTQIGALPDQLRRSLTWDQGAEMAQHVQLKTAADIAVYFCDPHSPWQRPSNENTNGLLRQYFPKGTDLSRWNDHELQAVAVTLNHRPRRRPD